VPDLSIVIPTFRRASTLERCLDHLQAQTIRGDLEVIVVSDGHDDATQEMMQKKKWNLDLHFFEIEKSQQGVARNRGVERVTSLITLFLGDDMFLGPATCEVHLRVHKEHRTAVLGSIMWDPQVGITPVMRWLETSGWQFGYPMIQKFAHDFIPPSLQHRFTYTGNLSLPTEWAKKRPFREDVTLYGWEDIEWGLRLQESGVKLFYEPAAWAIHHHKMELDQSLARMETLGKSVVQVSKLNPKLDRLPRGWKRLAYEVAALPPTMAGRHRRAFLRGIRHAQK
jgi:GT2 family glycosyltransferase